MSDCIYIYYMLLDQSSEDMRNTYLCFIVHEGNGTREKWHCKLSSHTEKITTVISPDGDISCLLVFCLTIAGILWQNTSHVALKNAYVSKWVIARPDTNFRITMGLYVYYNSERRIRDWPTLFTFIINMLPNLFGLIFLSNSSLYNKYSVTQYTTHVVSTFFKQSNTAFCMTDDKH